MATTKHDDCPFKDIVFPEANKMDAHIKHLEGVVEQLTHDIQQVSQSINAMGTELGKFKEIVADSLAKIRDSFTNQIGMVADRLTVSAKPQWQTISAFVLLADTLLGMAGAVVALIMSGQSENIASLKRETTTITDRMFQNQYEKGKSDAFASEVAGHLAKLDLTLQREMTLIQQTTDSKISGLDDKIQSELRLQGKTSSADLARLDTEINNLRVWRLEHASEGAAVDARLGAKVETLIEIIRMIEGRVHADEVKK